MTVDTLPRAVQVTLVHSPACHFCDDAAAALDDLGSEYALEVTALSIESPEGAELVATHRPAMSPLVLVDGTFFSQGRLPRKKLVKLLNERGAALRTAGNVVR